MICSQALCFKLFSKTKGKRDSSPRSKFSVKFLNQYFGAYQSQIHRNEQPFNHLVNNHSRNRYGLKYHLGSSNPYSPYGSCPLRSRSFFWSSDWLCSRYRYRNRDFSSYRFPSGSIYTWNYTQRRNFRSPPYPSSRSKCYHSFSRYISGDWQDFRKNNSSYRALLKQRLWCAFVSRKFVNALQWNPSEEYNPNTEKFSKGKSEINMCTIGKANAISPTSCFFNRSNQPQNETVWNTSSRLELVFQLESGAFISVLKIRTYTMIIQIFNVYNQDQLNTSKTLTIAYQSEVFVIQNPSSTCYLSAEEIAKNFMFPSAVVLIKYNVFAKLSFGKQIWNTTIQDCTVVPWVSNIPSVINLKSLPSLHVLKRNFLSFCLFIKSIQITNISSPIRYELCFSNWNIENVFA